MELQKQEDAANARVRKVDEKGRRWHIRCTVEDATNTLGLWNVMCTVEGGGTSGQVDAIRLGVSRALQNWEPGLRPPLREDGFLTRDPRVVERKMPGKAKARKSFQWVKR